MRVHALQSIHVIDVPMAQISDISEETERLCEKGNW